MSSLRELSQLECSVFTLPYSSVPPPKQCPQHPEPPHVGLLDPGSERNFLELLEAESLLYAREGVGDGDRTSYPQRKEDAEEMKGPRVPVEIEDGATQTRCGSHSGKEPEGVLAVEVMDQEIGEAEVSGRERVFQRVQPLWPYRYASSSAGGW